MNYASKMLEALVYASNSPDPSTQNAALLYGKDDQLLVSAVNAFPNGVVMSDERWTRPSKYFYVEHAERNAIYQAAKLGIPTRGTTMVAVWAACHDCARAIIQAGITTVVRYEVPDNPRHWQESNEVGELLLLEAGVKVITLKTIYGEDEVPPLLLNEEFWRATLPIETENFRPLP